MDNMVLDHEKDVGITVQAEKLPSDQRQNCEVERLLQLFSKEFIRSPRLFLNVDDLQVNSPGLVDDLIKKIFSFTECSAINLVPLDNGLQRLPQCLDFEIATESKPGIKPVGQVCRVHLVDEPDTLLRK